MPFKLHKLISLFYTVILFYVVIIILTNDYPDWPNHPWPTIILIYVEVFAVFYALIRMLRYAIFFLASTIISTIVCAGHIIEMRKSLENVLVRYSQKNMRIPFKEKWIIDRHLVEHNKVCYYILYGSIAIFGNVMYAFLWTNIPINIILLRRNLFIQNQAVMDFYLIWLIWLCQLAAAMVFFIPLSWDHAVYHSPKKIIVKLQAMMAGSRWMFTKLKYDDLYNRLISGPKLGVMIGPIDCITYWSSLQVWNY